MKQVQRVRDSFYSLSNMESSPTTEGVHALQKLSHTCLSLFMNGSQKYEMNFWHMRIDLSHLRQTYRNMIKFR